MKHEPLRNRCLVPPWLRLKYLQRIPDAWVDLVYEFIGLVDQMFRDCPPAAGVLQAGHADGQLQLRLRCRPAPSVREQEVLHGIALRLCQLSRYQYGAEHALPSSPVWGYRPSAAPHNVANFDLDEYIEDRIDRALKPQEVTVFEWDSMAQLEKRASARDEAHARRVAQAMARLNETGATRPLAKPAGDWAGQLEQLQREAPNFAAVLQAMVRPHLAMCQLGIRHRLPPILLVGPPGVGKTKFAHALARLLGVPPPLVVSFAEETNAAALAGSSTFWSNSSPGKLFEHLAWGSQGRDPVANPLVVVDELDKRAGHTFDPLSALYSLLEVDTAKCFTDQSVPDITIDASHVRLIATANDIDALPEPLRSRLAIFTIEPPTEQQLAEIVRNIYRALVAGMNIAMQQDLPDEVVRQAVVLSPRVIKSRLETCIGHALLAGRTEVQGCDWALANLGLGAPQRARIGFINGAG
ncbi:AAA family ATPase [Aquabacterium sp. OR-4]|uniref:AAA family ATPase n=1 Tax=Aquabacterium sp. OR-4 TaxID=2978127 RepID=UPI0028CA514F|nr:AAA family ATPase [Aquabacterium sp. OR-4]MDT7834118.1 AAA family ATPase [Aquabacterium sp. OR-4]